MNGTDRKAGLRRAARRGDVAAADVLSLLEDGRSILADLERIANGWPWPKHLAREALKRLRSVKARAAGHP